MSEVNFYLKKAEKSTGLSLILLKFNYSGNRLVYSFGQSIDPKSWNENKQRVKNNKQATADGDYLLNDLLDNLESVCKNAYKSLLVDGTPIPSQIREHLIAFLNQKTENEKGGPTLFKLIERFISGEILTRKGQRKSIGSITNYNSVKLHLEKFEKLHRYKIDFTSITLDFFYKYVAFLKTTDEKKGCNLSDNSIAKDISILKVFMAEAVDLGYTKNLQFQNKKFSFSEVETEQVYLTVKEIMHLYRFDFSDNKRMERARDLFVFGCFVGLRYSDYSKIKPEHIFQEGSDYYIKMVTQKTKEPVTIPCNPVIVQIFEKYKENNNRLPKAFVLQEFNRLIKKVCETAGLTEVGRLPSKPDAKLCDHISSHTCRRSFATNYYLQGFPTIDLMKMTGHKTEKSFLKYIRVSNEDAAKRLNEHIKQNLSSLMMKVA